MHVYISIYIYIYRERQREREGERLVKHNGHKFNPVFQERFPAVDVLSLGGFSKQIRDISTADVSLYE